MSRFKVAVAMSVLAALACGSGPIDYTRSSKAEWGPNVDAAGLHDVFLAPPDRALQGVHVLVRAPTYQAAADAIRAEQEAFATALSDAPGCAMRVLDYARPDGREDRWHARLELVVDAELVGLATPAERMDRVDRCAKVVAERQAEEVERNAAVVTVGAGAPVPVVDAPERYLAELVARETARLAAAAAIGGAPQLHPEDLRCVPDGKVVVGRRLVSGVELSTTVTCRVAERPPADG